MGVRGLYKIDHHQYKDTGYDTRNKKQKFYIVQLLLFCGEDAFA
jgi:hypothetical protein